LLSQTAYMIIRQNKEKVNRGNEKNIYLEFRSAIRQNAAFWQHSVLGFRL